MHSQCLRFIRVWFVTSMFDQDKKSCSVTDGNIAHVTLVSLYFHKNLTLLCDQRIYMSVMFHLFQYLHIFYKLSKIGIKGKFYDILQNMYILNEVSIHIGD